MNQPAESWVARFAVRSDAARAVVERLFECLDGSETSVAYLERAPGAWEIELGFAHAPDADALRDLIASLADPATARSLRLQPVQARDWVAASLADLGPVVAGRFVVHGSHDRARRPRGIGIEIDAALAFGTGHHGTTRGCLLALDRILRRHRPLRVLDVGTGTGVLAIAAAKAARSLVIASDIDRQAVRVAKANAQANGIAPFVRVVHAGSVRAPPVRVRKPYDLVLANILLRPLVGMASELAALARPGGVVVLSGLLRSQAQAALSRYRLQGLHLRARIDLDEWTTLVLARDGANRSRKRHRPGGRSPGRCR